MYFLVPSLISFIFCESSDFFSSISFIFSVISAFNNEVKEDFDVCKTCIVHPNKTEGTDTCGYFVGQMDAAD